MTNHLRLVLHIGRHKSGTSSIQHYLHKNRDDLLEHGILYPRAGALPRIAHHQLVEQCDGRRSDGAELDDLIEAIKQEITPTTHTIVLSSEGFQNIRSLDRVDAMLAALNCNEVVVICYLREAVDYAVSAYRQRMHAQPVYETFTSYARRFGDLTGFFDRWAKRGRLVAKWFERDLLINADIVADFCAEADLPHNDEPLDDRNPSLGGNLFYFKLLANRFEEHFLTYHELAALAVSEARFNAPFFVPDHLVAQLRHESGYNRSVTELLGPPRLRDFSTLAALPTTETLASDLALIHAAYPDAELGWLEQRVAEPALEWI